MSPSRRANWLQSGWRIGAALALVMGFLVPLWGAPSVAAQGTLPATAAAAPEGTVLFQTIDLDREGAQWQQAEALLARVGKPDALDRWEARMLERGERRGDFTQADLDALLGGELAFVVTPLAVQRVAEHHQRHQQRHQQDASADTTAEAATPMHALDDPIGVTAVLLPGDPDAAWDYVQRQIADLSARRDITVEEITHGGGELIWVQPPDRQPQMEAQVDAILGDAALGQAADQWIDQISQFGRPGFAAGRAGDYIILGVSQDDVTEIIDTVDGTTPSLADSAAAQQVAAELPAEALGFTYCNGAAILAALPERTAEHMMAMMPEADQAMWQTTSGMAVSAVEAGLRIDAITVPGESGNLGAMVMANDPAIAAAAARVPSDAVFYQAGVVPEYALAGAAYMLALSVNGAMTGDEHHQAAMQQMPTPEEMEAEMAQASQMLGFDLQADLFALLGGEFFMFSSFPTFDMSGINLDAVAAIATTDPDTLTRTSRQIAALIDRAGPEADVSVRQVEGNTLYVVSDPESPDTPSLEFGVVGDQAVVGTEGGITALATEPTSALADDPQFKEVMSALPAEYYQVAYVNIGAVIDPLMMLFAGMDGPQPTPDAGIDCADYADQAAAQAAYDEDQVANAGLDLDFDGQACEDAYATAEASSPPPSLANIRSFAAVSFQRDDAMGSSAILQIAAP